jgi:hypothetical protein
VDVPTLFSGSSDAGSTGVAPAGDATLAGDDSAAINTDELLGTAAVTPDPATTPSEPVGQVGDPLAGTDDANAAANSDTANTEDDIVPNDTITTNDWSKVGDVKPEDQPVETPPVLPMPDGEPEEEIIPEIVAEPEAPPFASELKYKLPGVDDPEKVAFIKTYTEEFDEALKRATKAVEDILDAIDRAVHEHSPDITVPDAAEEFISKKPADNKVEKFEDAREIIHEVLARAADAKEQSAKAAEEAARIYDEVQSFKQKTKEQIVELTSSGEQSPPNPPGLPGLPA